MFSPVGHASYGGIATAGGDGFGATSGAFKRSQRVRLNIYPALVGLFVPWWVFCTVFYAISFPLQVSHPISGYIVVGLSFGATLVCFLLVWWLRIGRGGEGRGSPSWLTFCFFTMALALVAGCVAGAENYTFNTRVFYGVSSLMEYTDVNPSLVLGKQFMDAGMVEFSKGTHLGLSQSMGFRHAGIEYCVAPIVFGNVTARTFDFWAVGRDCCSASTADFHCPGFNILKARGGLRLLDDHARTYYRMAVQEAEATYEIKAAHPLFFEWVVDAPNKANEYMATACRLYMAGVCVHFVLQLFLVAIAAMGFSTLVNV
eukprot:TRINITY_DN55696_c0_g1_i1.p1 TRINITY_DN55696_c0_g1~~TRINITY_DN55696_c0_g1_i1.p1  ORF type:complete len:315 (-),score=35.67 TRINITY_DN55696_c0_g1_i1:107-1051(-)